MEAITIGFNPNNYKKNGTPLANLTSQGQFENIADMDDQTEGNASSALEDGTEVALAQIKAPFPEHVVELDLTVVVCAHQRIQLHADGVLIFCIHITGCCGDGVSVHGQTSLAIFLYFHYS